MSGTPTEGEIQSQWAKAVDILETARAHIDGTMAPGGGKFDVLLQALEGDYTPVELSSAVARYRSAYSSLIDPGTALEFLSPIIREYAPILAADATVGYGSGYRDIQSLFRAIYEWFVAKGYTVETRAITFDTTPTVAGTGNGTLSRVTVDENAFDLEACTIERKVFRCRADQNSGADEHAELFEFVGAAASPDAVLRGSHGSGEGTRTTIVSKNAGTGAGGSLLQNSSFSVYDATATDQRFSGWAQTYAGGSADTDITQDTTNYYRSHPGASTNGSLKITAAVGATTTLKQTLANMRIARLDTARPYFLRLMWNRSIGSATTGTLYLRLGSQSASVALAAQSGWQELMIAADENCWFANFNEDPFDVEIEWDQGTSSGYLLIDDVLFAPYDLIDGTFFSIRQNNASPTSWLVDDTITVTDTGGAAGTGKIQWWCNVAGLGYLPSDGSPSFADP